MNSFCTDFKGDHGEPAPVLEAIAAAGFSHIQWSHHWNTDFIYTKPEIDYIKEDFLKKAFEVSKKITTIIDDEKLKRNKAKVTKWKQRK